MLKTFARITALLTLVIITGAVGLHGGQATAGTSVFTVTKTTDTADGTCDSDCSVREAFIAANAAGVLTTAGIATATIQIPAGTYTLAIAGADENASATGDFDVTSPITVVGAGPTMTILDGANLDRLVDVRDTGSLNISGLTIRHGKAGADATAGLRADGPLTMTNVHVVNNNAVGTNDNGSTGGVTVRHQALITDSVISNNTATGNSTAGLFANETSNVTVRNTTIEGNSTAGDFPTGGVGLFGMALLDNVIVRNNGASGKEPVGGIFAGGKSIVTIRNSQILNNDTTGNLAVGGIFSKGQMTVWDTIIDGHDTGMGGVGGILSLPNDAKTSTITLRRVVVTNNSAQSNIAVGGIAIQTPADLGEVTIDHNSAGDSADGGMKFFDANAVTLDRVSVTHNTAGTDATGGMIVTGGSHVTVTDSSFDHNSTGGNATGGVYVDSQSTLNLTRVAVTNNSTSGDSSTGGLGVYQATATLTNVTVSGNSAVGNATGGLYVENGTLTVNFTTIDNNTAGNVGGVGGLTSYGTLHVSNSIVGHNPGENSCWQTAGASTGHNIDQSNDCGFNLATDMHSTDPMLGSLGDSGGFSLTESIAPSSPAKDGAGACPLDSDQRVFPRPQGNACDIGAFEAGSLSTTDRVWGDTLCSNGVGGDDALAGIAAFAGVTLSQPAGALCPALSQNVYVGGWFVSHLWGDWDCDAIVNMLDVLQILRAAAEIPLTPTNPCPQLGDTVPIY